MHHNSFEDWENAAGYRICREHLPHVLSRPTLPVICTHCLEDTHWNIMQNDAATLSKQLHRALGWDASMVTNVVQAITAAAQTGNASEIEGIVQVRPVVELGD